MHDDGTVTVGSMTMGYFAQRARKVLEGDRTVFQFLEDAFPPTGQESRRTPARKPRAGGTGWLHDETWTSPSIGRSFQIEDCRVRLTHQ